MAIHMLQMLPVDLTWYKNEALKIALQNYCAVLP